MTTARTRILALAGICGPILFALAVLVQQSIRSPYDPNAQLISDLTAGPDGWVQQVSFIVFGLLVIAFATGLRTAVRGTRGVSPAIVALNGVQLVVGGLTPLRMDAAGTVYDPTGVHTVNGAIFFLGIGVVLVLLALRLREDPRWLGLAGYTRVTGFVLLALLVVLLALARPASGPLHEWFGLLQRVSLMVWSVCVVTLAARLWRVAAQHPTPSLSEETPA